MFVHVPHVRVDSAVQVPGATAGSGGAKRCGNAPGGQTGVTGAYSVCAFAKLGVSSALNWCARMLHWSVWALTGLIRTLSNPNPLLMRTPVDENICL